MKEQPTALRLADALDERVVPRWIHATGQTPQQSGYARDILCAEAAVELRRLHAECNDLAHQLNQSNERNGRLIAQRDAIQQVVDEQAEDEGLWFRAETAAEAYLQQELRRLHAAVEGEK